MEGGLRDSARRVEEYARDALDSLPPDLRAQCGTWKSWSKTTRRPDSGCSASIRAYRSLDAAVTTAACCRTRSPIYREPLVRLYGHDPGRLRQEVRRVVLHEIAHHFGISDERLIEIDRY
jgi:predicted Zn-dependent protease with MMP-like domain